MRISKGWWSGRHAGGAIFGMMLTVGGAPTVALANTVFTWDLSAAIPSLGGAAFTADAIEGAHYLYDDTPPTGSSAIYTVDFIEKITQFTLNGQPVATPGLNGTPGAPGSYGLYLSMQAQAQQSGAMRIYRSLSMSLMGDPGNNDGAVSSTLASQLAFANTGPTGVADDVTLATGSLISGKFKQNPAPGISVLSDFTESFTPGPSESGFFVSPVSPYAILEEFLTTPTAAIQFVPQSDGSTIALLNGGGATMDLLVPEPASLTLVGTGVAAIISLRRRVRRNR